MSERKSFNEINITPLTDIFLVLLIIMMVVAPMLDQQGLNLAVPNTIEVEDQDYKELKLIRITVMDDDTYVADDVEIPVSELGSYIKENAEENPDGLLILTSENSTHGAMVKVLDEARNVGVKNVSVSEAY